MCSASLTAFSCLMFIENNLHCHSITIKDMVGCDRMIPPNAANLKADLKGPLLSICFSNMN